MPENPENEKLRIDDPGFMENFREVYAVELEKLRKIRPVVIGDDPEKVIGGEPIASKETQWSLFVRVGQDFHLSHDEIDELGKKFFLP